MSQSLDTLLDCNVLAQAVAVLTDPASSHVQRTVAQHVFDEFKQKSPLYVTYGLQLAENTGNAPVRLFGLQAIEYFVKFRWDQLAWDGRLYLKDRVVKLISDLAISILEEDSSIKETLVSILVEIIKRDWPEFWSGLFAELNVLCLKGPLQAELVMRTLLQMVEETTFPHARAYIFKCALTASYNVQRILEVVRILLRDSVVHYRLRKTHINLVSPIQEYYCVIQTTLKTLAGYLSWVDVAHITENNFQLLEMMWCLLTDPELQLEVAECLHIALNRIGTPPGCKPLLLVFEYVAITNLFPALETTVGEVLTERRYHFLKTLCQLMCIFGAQLCRTLDLNGCPPSNFGNYLDNLLDFTTHCSQRLSSYTQSVWRELFSHKLLSSDPRLLAMIPRYLLSTRTKLMKVGFPSKNNSLTCEYSRFYFANDQAFSDFLTTFREEQKQVIDAACQLDQVTCFQMTIDWLKELVLSSDSGSYHSSSPDGWCDLDTHTFLQWEAFTFFIKVVTTNILRKMKKGSTIVNDGIEMLQLLLNFKTTDLLVLSCIPTTICTLLPFLNLKKECLPQVLTKLLNIIEDIKAPKAPPLTSARRIAFFSINQICRENAEICLPSFEMLFSHVKQLLCDELLQLTQMERCLLMEAVVVLINQFKNYERQKAYLEELIAPVTSLWLSEEMQRVFADPKAFVSFVGADLPAIDTIGDSPTDLNRSGIIHCVATILGVLQWTCCPRDLEVAKAGGFIVGVSSGKLVCRNPCTEQVLKLLDNILVLIKTQHNLFLPEGLSKMCDKFPLALDILDVKNASSLNVGQPLLDIYDLSEYKTVPERMQGFFSALYGCCFYILGCAASTLKEDFYATKDLVNELCKSVFQNLENIPDYKLLCVVSFFLKPFVSSCSPDYYRTVVCSVLASFLPSLYARLSQKWNFVDQESMSNKSKTADNTESYEMQKKQYKLLTEEVVEFVIDCCVPPDDGKTEMLNVPSGVEIDKASLRIQDSSSTDGDVFASVAESDLVCLSRIDADTAVCTAESDDDDCFTTAEPSSGVATVNNILCSVLNKDPDGNVLTEDSTLAHSLHCDRAPSVAKFDNAFSLPREATYLKVVPTTENSVHIQVSENADAPTVASESDDGEIAAEVPQPDQLAFSKLSVRPQLTQLGICLMEDEAVRSALLCIAFSSLVWKDCCSREATRLCWPLLQQVILEPLLADTVTHLFTMTLKGLYLQRHDSFVSNAIIRLAFKIYASLRPRYVELNEVMKQIPNINLFDLQIFDEWLVNPTNQITHSKPQQCFKDLIKSGIYDTLGCPDQKEDNAENPLPLKMLNTQDPNQQQQLSNESSNYTPSKKRKK